MSLSLRKAWAAIRWKMPIIFSFFSIVSVAMVICFSIALLNVVIRRERGYLIEERIKISVESREGIIDPALDRIEGCEYASNAILSALFTERPNGTCADVSGKVQAVLIAFMRYVLKYKS